jgi:hypothetical protein
MSKNTTEIESIVYEMKSPLDEKEKLKESIKSLNKQIKPINDEISEFMSSNDMNYFEHAGIVFKVEEKLSVPYNELLLSEHLDPENLLVYKRNNEIRKKKFTMKTSKKRKH